MKAIAPFRVLVLVVALGAGLALLMSALGYRLGWWHFGTGFVVMRWAGYIGIGAGVLAIVALAIPPVRARGAGALAAALAVGAVAACVPWYWQERAGSVPGIHDISTDTENPPLFVAVLPLRAGTENTAAYGGKEVADQQRKGYPDIQPLTLAMPPQLAFTRAQEAAKAMGWEMVTADAAAGRIEATDTTFWYGFKDDIVIRVAPAGAGSRIDVRSVSRVGGSDVGVNARRIRAYLARLGG